MDKFQAAIDKANNAFKNNSFSVEIASMTAKLVKIEIEGGDWKHDHGFADYTMSINGFNKISEKITSTDDSDWYGSIHYYEF